MIKTGLDREIIHQFEGKLESYYNLRVNFGEEISALNP
jgi:hypothetical protein